MGWTPFGTRAEFCRQAGHGESIEIFDNHNIIPSNSQRGKEVDTQLLLCSIAPTLGQPWQSTLPQIGNFLAKTINPRLHVMGQMDC